MKSGHAVVTPKKFIDVAGPQRKEIVPARKKMKTGVIRSAQFEENGDVVLLEVKGNITISLSMNITMNQLGGASVIAKFHS